MIMKKRKGEKKKMNASNDAADRLIGFYFDGVEFALRISGSATKNVIAALYAISQEKNKTKGKIRLSTLLKSGKELKIFSVKKEDLKKFYEEANRYGVLYCALVNKDKNNPDGMVDIMVRAEDAPKINRIVDRFNLTTINTADIKKEIERTREANGQSPQDIGVEEKSAEDKLIEELLSKPIQKEENETTPSISKTEEDNQLEHFSENKEKLEGMAKKDEKPSVREQLKEIKQELENKEKEKEKVREEKSIPKEKKPKHMKEPKHMKKQARKKKRERSK